MKTDWNERLMDLAKHIAGWSKDRSTGVGCVIVNSKPYHRCPGYTDLMCRGKPVYELSDAVKRSIPSEMAYQYFLKKMGIRK